MRCAAWGTPEEALHWYGCPQEPYPWCQYQLMSCGCLLDHVSSQDARRCGGEACFLPATVWQPILDAEGRIPY